MAEHVWSVLCHRCIVDSRSNRVSLIDAIEELKVHSADGSVPAEGEVIAIDFGASLASLWMRSDHLQPESFKVRLKFMAPSGYCILQKSYDIELGDVERARAVTDLQKLQLTNESGSYFFQLEKCVKKRWSTVARIPLRVNWETPSEGNDMAKNEKTGKKAGTAASKTMRSKTASKDAKTAAASALTQRPDRKKK